MCVQGQQVSKPQTYLCLILPGSPKHSHMQGIKLLQRKCILHIGIWIYKHNICCITRKLQSSLLNFKLLKHHR